MTSTEHDYLLSLIRDVPDFPRPGIVFKDITPLLADGRAFSLAVRWMAEQVPAGSVDAVIGIESRGFVFASAVAERLGVGFIPSRKPGKLPAKVVRQDYALEYGKDAMELHADALSPGMSVLIVDDVIATGGTARAVVQLTKRLQAKVAGLVFLIELLDLEGSTLLDGHAYHSLLRLGAAS